MRNQTLLAALITSSLALPALAQSTPQTRPTAPTAAAAGSAGPPAHPGQTAGRKDWKKRAEWQRAKLEQALKKAGIDDARTKRIMAIHAKYGAERAKAFEQLRTNRQAVKQLLADNSKDEAAYRRALDGLRAGQKKLTGLRDQEISEASQVLKPSEIARVLSEWLRGHRGGERSFGQGYGPTGYGSPANRGAL